MTGLGGRDNTQDLITVKTGAQWGCAQAHTIEQLPNRLTEGAIKLSGVHNGIIHLQSPMLIPKVPARLLSPTLQRLPQSVICRRSEEHTSELQSRGQLVCRLLLEKK